MTYEELEQKTKSFRINLYHFFKNYVLGWILLFISIPIYLAVTFLGLVWLAVGYTYYAIRDKEKRHLLNIFKDLNHMAFQQAMAIDKAGNVTGAPFLNNVLGKKNPMFGVPLQDITLHEYLKYALHGSLRHTISVIHGLRTIAMTRTTHGHLFTRIVNYFDTNHFIKSVRTYFSNSRQENEFLSKKTGKNLL